MTLRNHVLPVLVLLCAASRAFAQNPPQTAPQAPPQVPVASMNLNNVALTEVIDQLARQLGMTVLVDPRVKGSVTLNTYGEIRGLDARNLLEMLLRINGAGMVEAGGIWRIVPLTEISRQPLRPQTLSNSKDIPEDDQTMLNLVFLKYVTVDELVKVLEPFTGENARILSYGPANLMFILDSRRAMHRTMELIAMFDSDSFANERVRLFELKNTRPSDIVKDLENILRSLSLDNKTSTVRFLPVDRISTLIAVAPNPGVFDTVETWLKKLDVPIDPATAANTTDTYVYRVRYGRSDCLAMAIGQLYMPFNGYGYGGGAPGYGGAYPGGGGAIPYGGGGNYGAFQAYGAGQYGGGYGGNYGGGGYGGGQYGGGQYGGGNAFNGSFGGSGGCYGGGFGNSPGPGGGYGGGGYGGGGYGGGYGAPVFGGYSAQVPPGTPLTGVSQGSAPAAGTQTNAATQQQPNPPRIVPNPLDNSLLIQADPAQYQAILKLLKELDVPPRQILLESKIYQVDLSGDFSLGISASFQARSGTDRRPLATLAAGISQFSAGMLVGQSRELLAFLNLNENASKVHTVSEPSLIATDSIPASINVGTQVPVLTSQVASPIQVGGTNTINQQISSRNTGVTLQVNVRVNPSGVVTLYIGQEISKPAGGSGGLTPSFSQQVVQTQITMQDGDTIAIGGIIAENGTETSSGLPGLSRIPIIGAVFGTRSYSHARSEFIIFMTPHVIYDTIDLLEASDELVGRVKKLRKYMKN